MGKNSNDQNTNAAATTENAPTKKGQKCQACEGTGLVSEHQLCQECLGSGTIES